MQTLMINRKWAFTVGLVFALPALVFISASILKEGFGWSFLYDTVEPTFQKAGLNEKLGWNINLLFIAGPGIAFLLNFFSVVMIDLHNERKQWFVYLRIRKNWLNISIILLSILILGTLFIYLVGENLDTAF